MKLKHIGRTLVCLLLVCCLVINISPIRAKATGAEIAIASAAVAALVIPAIFIACGVNQGESPTDFDYAVDSCKQWLSDAGEFLMDGLTAPIVWMAGTAYVSGSLIDAVRNWLFDSGTITSSERYIFSYSTSEKVLAAYQEAMSYPYHYVATSYGGTWTFIASESPIIAAPTSSGYSITFGSKGGYTYTLNSSSKVTKSFREANTVWGFVNIYESGVMDAVTSYDLVVNSLKAPSVSIATGYADWAAGAISVPGSKVGIDEEEEVLAYPLGFGQTYEETRDMTQADVWAGNGTYVDTKTEALTGTFADTAIGEFLTLLIDALVDSFLEVIVRPILAGIEAIFLPSEDFLTAKVDSLIAEYAFAEAIVNTAQFIGTSLQEIDTEPPVIYLDLAADRGPYDLGRKVPFIDLRWYEEYKPTGDTIISAFLWIVFGWRMLIKAPGIISGMPGDFVMQGVQNLGLSDMLPGRKKEYEQTRRDNRRMDK